MNKRTNLFGISLTAALAGFLFGFDTVVISGANLPIRNLWQLSDWEHGMLIMSMALWGTVIGSLFGGLPCDKLGRKKTLLWIGVLYFLSALGSALAPDPYVFSFFRFIGGVGVGASSVAAPIYISEISPSSSRGRLGAMYQFNIVFGIMIAFISNYLLKGFGGANDWRWMLGVEAIPAVIYVLLVLRIPRSPRWLSIQQKKQDEALAVLARINGPEEARRQMDLLLGYLDTHAKKDYIFRRGHARPLMLAFLIAFFNQLSGINFVLYYAPELLEKAGLASKESLFNSIAIGIVNLIFTLLGIWLIDRRGRRELMLIGSVGYIVSLAMVAYCFHFQSSPDLLLVFILVFIASHAVGQGAVIWVFISEIFPNQVRAAGQSWGTGTHWVLAALITLVTPTMLSRFEADPSPIFLFFAGMMVLQLLFVLFLMPETKGIALEEIEEE